MDKTLNKEIFDDFRNFLKMRECFNQTCPCDNDDNDSMEDEEIAEMAAKQADLFCQVRPKAVDILVEKEHGFLGVVKELIEKHKTLETMEQIEKLTKDILKLCK